MPILCVQSSGKKQIALDLLFDLLGGFLYACGVYTFAKMADFAPGGISGLALIFHHLWNLPIGIMTLLLNIPLILMSYKVVGKQFLFKSARSMIVCTIFVDFIFPYTTPYTGSSLLAALYYGILMGTGLAFIYARGSSTGGTDFLIMSIKAKLPHLSLGFVTVAIDLVVILLGWPVFGNVDAVLYGLISTFSVSFVVDKIMYGITAQKMIIIVTTCGDKMAELINEHTGRGATLIPARGTYSKEAKDIILCACSKAQAPSVTGMVHYHDASAFVMVTESSEVFGEGFIERVLGKAESSTSPSKEELI
ncbi:MAG: YitT family protein [Eubacteriales bacterium]